MRASSPPFQSRSLSLSPPNPNPPSMAPEQIPVIDLRFISQTELQTLSRSCPNSYDPLRLLSDESAAAPKIDRSVFNESAGSRKQTYSRLRLAPHSNSKRHNTNPNPNDPSSSSNLIDPSSHEHQQIISNLRRLFAREDPSFDLPAPPPPVAVTPPPQTLTLDASLNGKDKDKDKEEDDSKALVVFQNNDRDKEVLNAKDMAVDLAELAGKEDPYGEELRKRTAGLKSEPELLGFLGGLEGEWMSRRQRRRFVDASVFGDHLPKGWKLLLGLKRKEGVPWVNCRRYVSPNGLHFETCKEVSSYIQSLLGISAVPTPISTNMTTISLGEDKPSTLSVASHLMESDNGPKECTNCNLSFGDKGEYLQHQLSFHQKSRKRRRNSESIEDGTFMKDGKYVCRFCDKIFDERTRYLGHMEAHVKYQGLSPDENTFKSASIAIEGPPLIGALKNEKTSIIEANSGVVNPENEQAVPIESPSSVEKSKDERIHSVQPLPVENSKNDKTFPIETLPTVENPTTNNTNGIQAPPLIGDPKIDRIVPIQSPTLIKNPEEIKIPSTLPPSIEVPKSDISVSMLAPTSEKNPDNFVSKAPPIVNPENDNKSESSEIPLLPSNGNSKDDRKPETAAIHVLSTIEGPKNDTEPITMLLEKDGSVEMSEDKSLEGYTDNGASSSKVEEAVCGFLDNISGAGDALSGDVYQNGNATDNRPPFVYDHSNSSPSCSPESPDKDSEVENNMEKEHPSLSMNHEVAISKSKEAETSEVLNHVEVAPKNGIFDSTFANASTCSGEDSQQACPDIETFDLNNYDIVDDGSKPEDIISATHRMLFENDTGAMSDETSFMDCDSVGEPKEVELAERPVTFSELLANANAHANASLAETSQTCQESESLDLNNNTSDRIDNNEIDYEADKLATSNTTSTHTILTTTPTMDYNSDIFASCFSANMNEPNGVSGFDINTRDSLLEEWEKQDTGLENRFQNNNPSRCEDIVSGGTGHNFMEMMTMQDNLEGYTSLMQSACSIPVANMMQDKLNNVGYQYLNHNNGALPNYSGMRLAPPEPSGYVAMSSANNPLHFPVPQQTMMFGYGPPQMVSGMGLQLGWGLTPPTKMMMPQAPYQFTSVCAWCNREFRHDGSLAEQHQSDTVGFICPSCKDRFPGHGHLGV
ncbi:Methyl-CpG-binding domain-containing protein 8 [Rhynchospora pubera]|uniref:Methyl-CpG-binding domain-containing protein 8 n=1 Tax=Rhynchospora pubera TaxID=906938 RepID=A0AAV8G2F5_9POAL|nr:Methyl-CpG-binding domain-containing protein 8 [Rhynchospora pubera]